MGLVIEFRPRVAEKPADEASRGPAKIIIFSGVRFERLQDAADERRSGRKRRAAARNLAKVEQG
jgi:hypothetical protein